MMLAVEAGPGSMEGGNVGMVIRVGGFHPVPLQSAEWSANVRPLASLPVTSCVQAMTHDILVLARESVSTIAPAAIVLGIDQVEPSHIDEYSVEVPFSVWIQAAINRP